MSDSDFLLAEAQRQSHARYELCRKLERDIKKALEDADYPTLIIYVTGSIEDGATLTFALDKGYTQDILLENQELTTGDRMEFTLPVDLNIT